MKPLSRCHLIIAFAFALLGTGACGGSGAGSSPPASRGDAARLDVDAASASSAAATPAGTPMSVRLTSTPPGATAFVDGKEVGTTPTSYTVYVTGAAVTFVFKREGFKDASYSFVPQVAGEVHGRLVPMALASPPASAPTATP